MAGTQVYIGGLSYSVGEKDIDRFFKGFNGVGNIKIKKGFGFVEFRDSREAEDAIYEMNGKELLGRKVSVERVLSSENGSRSSLNRGSAFSRGRTHQQRYQSYGNRQSLPCHTKYKLLVTNLSSKVSWQELKSFMAQSGEVTFADAHKYQKNEGIVEFATHFDMRTAFSQLDGKPLRGRYIRLYEQPSQDCTNSIPFSYSRSRSRSPMPPVPKSRSSSNHSTSMASEFESPFVSEASFQVDN